MRTPVPRLLASSLVRHSLWICGSLFRYDNKCDADGNEEQGKELATREGTDQLCVGFAEIFDDDSKNRVANEKQASQNSVGLARAGPHKPQDPEQNDSFEKRLVKL
jgi:hypothetical protein